MLDIATTRIIHSNEANHDRPPWLWPLPCLDGVAPTIVTHRHNHSEPQPVVLRYDDDTPLPRFVPVFAARDAAVIYAGASPDRYLVCLDHPGGWCTQYSGFEHMFVRSTDRFRARRKQRVHAGDILGYLGVHAPALRFELGTYSEEDGYERIDVGARMRDWEMKMWNDKAHAPTRRSISDQRAA